MSLRGSFIRGGTAALLGASLVLAGCAEKPQTASGKKSDAKAYSGVSSSDAGFSAPGWKAGDQAAWEQQIKARNQAQNEYAKTR
jgi:hypothetical protein